MQNKKINVKFILSLTVLFFITYLITYYLSGLFLSINSNEKNRSEFRNVSPINSDRLNNDSVLEDTQESINNLDDEEVDNLQD